MDLKAIGWEGVDWIHLAQDRDQWRAVVNTLMNLRVPLKAGNFLTNRVAVLTSQPGPRSMESAEQNIGGLCTGKPTFHLV